ncbi:unnamed protein product [Polarella glacialis]|uniref:Thioredoxin domain-containing protein n=1 Tax=Polarella glacialis TaxID=89957 RepID=A0A813H077_POLGL|nr:unnamed protein product [Polarella glacialis]
MITFGEGRCTSCSEVRDALELADEELRSAYTIPALVDRADSAGLWKRFGIREVPTTLFIGKGKMVRDTGQSKDASDFVNFVNNALEASTVGEKVPPEPSMVDKLLDMVRGIFGSGEL